MSHHDALMYIAQAAMGVVYVDRYNTLRIRQTVSEQALNTMPYTEELTLNMQETYPKIAIQDPYNYFTIKIYSKVVAGSSSTIYSGAVTITAQTSLWVTYTTPASASTCLASVVGGSLVSALYYTNAAYLTIGGSGAVAIAITGNAITSTAVQSILNSSGTQPVNEVDLDNPLVINATMATNILNWYAAECLNTFLYEVESWGDPSLENGDILAWDSQYFTNSRYAKLIRQNFRFSGTLSCTMNGKGW